MTPQSARRAIEVRERRPCGWLDLDLRQLATPARINSWRTPSTRVLLVDDHPPIRDGLKTLIDREPDLRVVGEASSEEEAVRIVAAVSAETSMVDVSLSRSSGVKVTESILSIVPTIRVIGVTRHTDQAFVAKMLGAAAWGYVLKQSPSSELLPAIRTVAGGDRFIDPAVQRAVEVDSSRTRESEFTSGGEPLTSIEDQVLRLIAKAYSNEEIARRLAIRVSDVAELKSSGMTKAGLISRLQVIAYAQSRGWQ